MAPAVEGAHLGGHVHSQFGEGNWSVGVAVSHDLLATCAWGRWRGVRR